MRAYFSHPFTDQNDLKAMLALIKARPADRIMEFPSLVDLREMLSLPEIRANTNLWEDLEGNLASFAILSRDDTSCNLVFEMAFQTMASDLSAQIMQWAEQASRQSDQPIQGELVLETRCQGDDLARMVFLEQNGFARQSVESLHLVRPLDVPIPTAEPPDGFSIRSFLGVQEVPEWVRLHRAAFRSQNMTEAYRLAMLNGPDYDPALDLVAVTPDGNLSAYCVGYIDQEENLLTGQKVGFTDPVATHPAYQRQGLGRALLLTALERLQKRGMLAARLSTSSENFAMQKAAQAVGFRESSRSLSFTKTL
jgi:mycothiol synthase